MSASGHGDRSNRQATTVLKSLLGSLELEVMKIMWQVSEATVREVTQTINRVRPIAYTSVMTVMGHLVKKGLLERTKEGKRYQYRVVMSREKFLQEASRAKIRALMDDFGDLAIAQFLGEIGEVDTDRLQQLRGLAQQASGESDASE